MLFRKLKINEVFTPRRADVNTNVYISRPVLEKELKRSLEGSLHTLIFGNSGVGKSWLYKKVLSDMKAKSVIANCANASRLGSITKEIVQAALPKGKHELEGLEEEITADVSALIAKGGAKSKRKYSILTEDPLLTAFHYLRKTANSHTAVLVLDNLETIINNEKLMDELANIIILCDDSRYSQYNIKILIVGVPSCILNYFSKVKNLPTVANRIQEISEVSNLNDSQVNAFVEVGFVSLLETRIISSIFDEWKSHIFNVTLGIPQRLHEYCECLAYKLEDNKWNATIELLRQADESWLMQGLRESYSTIDALMNGRETEIGRKNQVLYILGKIQIHYFTPKHISDRLKKEFPTTTSDIKLGINKILADLAAKDNSIIKKCSVGTRFEFTDPRYLMALRIMLVKDKNEKVNKLGFKM